MWRNFNCISTLYGGHISTFYEFIKTGPMCKFSGDVFRISDSYENLLSLAGSTQTTAGRVG